MVISEHTSLLGETENGKDYFKLSLVKRLFSELALLASTWIPASLGYAVQNSIQTVSIAVVSRTGTDRELSATAHGFMIAMVTAWCIALGGTTAFDTLASAAFARAKSSSRMSTSPPEAIVGILLQRTVLVLLLLYLPCAVLWVFSAPVLIKLGQPQDVAFEIQRFLRMLAFGAPGYILFESGKKFCLIQGSGAPTIILFLMAPINILLNLLTVWWLDLGLIGSPIAVSVTYYMCSLLLALHVKTIGHQSTGRAWTGFDRRALELDHCFAMLKLAIPGILMVGSEWAAFEIVALAAGNLDSTSLAAQSVIMTCDQILNTLPFGLSVASSTRIGNLLGEATLEVSLTKKSIHRLRLASQTAVFLATLLGLLIGVMLMIFREDFGRLFSDQKATVTLVADVLPLVAAFQIFDGWAAANGGTLRGMGKQHIGATANLISYYLIALPIGIYLAFYFGHQSGDADSRGMGLRGLWTGNALALGLVGAAEWIIVSFTRWDREIEHARKRAGEDEE